MPAIWTPPYPALKYTADQSAEAHENWSCNCGPHSLAAALGKTLDEVRAAIPNFRGWMNPTQIGETIQALGGGYLLRRGLRTPKLCEGINRVQWEGPWLKPGVPPRVAYQHTHLIAHFDGWVICTVICPWAWVHVDEWKRQLAAAGDSWHVTHHWELG